MPYNAEQHRQWYVRNIDKRHAQMKLRKDAMTERVRDLKRGPCTDCTLTFDPVCMDFDHIGKDKVENVSRMLNWGWPKIESEIAKCELVCSNCHRLRTSRRLTQAEREGSAKS